MKLRQLLAFFLLLVFFPCSTTAQPPIATGPSAPLHGSPAPSLRQQVVRRLATPNTAVVVLSTGVLLLFAECNLPGTVLPGALGLFLLLSGVYGLSLQPRSNVASLALLLAAALLLVSARLRHFPVPAAVGTLALIYGFLHLVRPPVHPAIAIAAGLLIGLSSTALGRIATLARRNKAILSTPPQPRPANLRRVD